jgi:hypothetical protein
MLEVWEYVGYEKKWARYCSAIFGGLNSLLGFAFCCKGKRFIVPVLSHLQAILKTAHKEKFLSHLKSIEEEAEYEPMFHFLQSLVAIQDYYPFYCQAFTSLLRFIAGYQDETDELAGATLLNLLHDIPICSDVSKLSSLESKDYVKVISIISSAMLITAPMDIPNGNRGKYVEAALLIGGRFRYLLAVNTISTHDEAEFWHKSEVEGYKLADYCDEERLRACKNLFPRLQLPKFVDSFDSEIEDRSLDEDFLSVTLDTESRRVSAPSFHRPSSLQRMLSVAPANTALLARRSSLPSILPLAANVDSMATSSDAITVPNTTRGLLVGEMREILALKGLSTHGKKAELQQRLADCAGYTDEPAAKRSKRVQSECSSSDEEEEAKSMD